MREKLRKKTETNRNWMQKPMHAPKFINIDIELWRGLGGIECDMLDSWILVCIYRNFQMIFSTKCENCKCKLHCSANCMEFSLILCAVALYLLAINQIEFSTVCMWFLMDERMDARIWLKSIQFFAPRMNRMEFNGCTWSGILGDRWRWFAIGWYEHECMWFYHLPNSTIRSTDLPIHSPVGEKIPSGKHTACIYTFQIWANSSTGCPNTSESDGLIDVVFQGTYTIRWVIRNSGQPDTSSERCCFTTKIKLTKWEIESAWEPLRPPNHHRTP